MDSNPLLPRFETYDQARKLHETGQMGPDDLEALICHEFDDIAIHYVTKDNVGEASYWVRKTTSDQLMRKILYLPPNGIQLNNEDAVYQYLDAHPEIRFDDFPIMEASTRNLVTARYLWRFDRQTISKALVQLVPDIFGYDRVYAYLKVYAVIRQNPDVEKYLENNPREVEPLELVNSIREFGPQRERSFNATELGQYAVHWNTIYKTWRDSDARWYAFVSMKGEFDATRIEQRDVQIKLDLVTPAQAMIIAEIYSIKGMYADLERILQGQFFALDWCSDRHT